MAERTSVPCPACSEPVPVADDDLWHFEGKPVPCGRCGTPLDWWEAACRAIETRFAYDKALAFAGPRATGSVRIPSSAMDESWKGMADAVEAYSQKRYPSIIVPASVAVESSLSGLLSSHLPSLVHPGSAANYPHQLHVLLPLVAHYNGIPQLPRPVRAALDRLRARREEPAHAAAAAAAAAAPLDAHGAAELLCGALFGFRYVRYVEGRLLRATSPSNAAAG
jgi:hypothetical protein